MEYFILQQSHSFLGEYILWQYNFNSEEKREDIGSVIKDLVVQYGIDLLQDVNRTNALLMDYVPRLKKERKLIIMVLKEGVFYQLVKLKGATKEIQTFEIKKCVRQLMQNLWITEEAATYAVSILVDAIISVEVTEKENKNQAIFNLITLIKVYEEKIAKETDRNDKKIGKILLKEMLVSSKENIYEVLKNFDAIGYKAFAANGTIETLRLPNSIQIIYPKAFFNCTNLRSIMLPKELQAIGTSAFEGCYSLEQIVISENANFAVMDGVLIDKIQKKVIRVENRKNQEIVNLINGVTMICKKAFEYSNVKQINIPMSVKEIEINAFFKTMELEKFEVDLKNMEYKSLEGVLHNKKGTTLIRYPQAKQGVNYYLEDSVEEIGLQAFSWAKNIQTITFTSTLKRIGVKAFEYCLNMENLMLPSSIEMIGDRAFQYCRNLRSIMLSRNIVEIGDCAFYACSSLETISIPKNVQRIGHFAFANCKSLRSVTMQENIAFIGDNAFQGCENIELFVRNNSYVETYCRLRGMKYTEL